MFFFLLFLIMMIGVNAKIFDCSTFNEEYLSKDNTKVIKGVFVVLVFFSHYVQYVTLNSIWDEPYLVLREHLNQMVVVPFLFYSGYGVMLSIQKKERHYVKGLIRYRFPRVWFDFAFAVVCFFVVQTMLGKMFPIKQVLLSFTGWSSIGNSNWYILGILILYFFTWLSFSIVKTDSRRRNILGCLLLTIFTIGIVYTFMRVGRPNYYYNTLILYVAGCWYALLHEKIESVIMKNDFIYFVIFTFSVGIYCLSYIKRWEYGIEGYTIWAMMFMALLLLISMKFSFKSNILSWFGDHVFSIYILQRIPMIILSYLGFAENHRYMFLLVSLCCTMVLAVIFEKSVDFLYKKIQRK